MDTYAKMEGKTDGGRDGDGGEAVRETQEHINPHTNWIREKTSELMHLV